VGGSAVMKRWASAAWASHGPNRLGGRGHPSRGRDYLRNETCRSFPGSASRLPTITAICSRALRAIERDQHHVHESDVRDRSLGKPGVAAPALNVAAVPQYWRIPTMHFGTPMAQRLLPLVVVLPVQSHDCASRVSLALHTREVTCGPTGAGGCLRIKTGQGPQVEVAGS
jgi:hypothetical protein